MVTTGEEDTDNTPTPLNLVFRREEIALGHSRKPTIRRIVVKGKGAGTLQLTLTDIDGNTVDCGTVSLAAGNGNTYYNPKGIMTAECPQLSITSSDFKGEITKVMLAGTYADGEID